MFDEITGEKKVCIIRKIRNSIFSVLIFGNTITLLSRGLLFEMCWVSKGHNGRCLKQWQNISFKKMEETNRK